MNQPAILGFSLSLGLLSPHPTGAGNRPSVPTGPVATATNCNAVTLGWNPSTDSSGYGLSIAEGDLAQRVDSDLGVDLGRWCRGGIARVGRHPLRRGRFCRRLPAARRADRHVRRLEVRARRLPTHAGGLLDPAERPAQPPQRNHLLSFLGTQDIAHPNGGPAARRLRQRLGTRRRDGRFSGVDHWPVLGVDRGVISPRRVAHTFGVMASCVDPAVTRFRVRLCGADCAAFAPTRPPPAWSIERWPLRCRARREATRRAGGRAPRVGSIGRPPPRPAG